MATELKTRAKRERMLLVLLFGEKITSWSGKKPEKEKYKAEMK